MVQQAGSGAHGVGAGYAAAGPLSGVLPLRAQLRELLSRQLEAEQDRWFLWLPVALGLGIACYFMLPAEPALALALMPLVAAVALRRALQGTVLVHLSTIAMLAVTVGFALAKVRTEMVRAPVLSQQLAQVQVEGFVELVEPRAGKGQRLTLRPYRIERLDDEAMPARVRVRSMRENAALKPGDAVRLKASLSPPPTPALPGDFDFARAAWFGRVGAVGSSLAAAEVVADAPEAPRSLRFFAAIERVRQAIGKRVTEALPGEAGAIANALVTGERGGISEATNQAFRDSGLYHILSISGLHMTIIAGATFLFLRTLLAAFPAIALRYPTRKWAAVGAMAATLCYLLISGSAFATVRSYVMISIMFLAVLLDRPAIALRNVALAALAILVCWPESLFDAGFQMSFAAVVALVSAYEWLRARRAEGGGRSGLLGRGVLAAFLFLGGIVLTTLIASLAVAPFGIYHFHNTQSYAVLANLIAIPICNFLVMPAALGALLLMPLGLEAGPLWLMGLGIEGMVWCAKGVASLPGAVGRVAAIPTVAFVLMVVGGLWLTLWRTRWRHLGFVAIAAGIALAPMRDRPDVLIGRGAELVAVRGKDGLLSASASRGSTFELARWLEHDGDGRGAAAAARGEAWRCDEMGCTARVKGWTIAVAKSHAALRDDCSSADMVIERFTQVSPCPDAILVIDRGRVAAEGAHAIWIDAAAKVEGVRRGAFRMETVAQARGSRPWSTPVMRGRMSQDMSTPAAVRDEVPADEP